MNKENVALVLTSCNRFDLLEMTLASFFKFNTYPISQHIIIEDSHNLVQLTKVLDKFPAIDFIVLNNDPQLGQMRSIDKAYACVTAEYIFHCEDDWEFYREGFIEDSFDVLKSDEKIVTVWLREQNDTNEHPVEPELFDSTSTKPIQYQIMLRNHKRRANSALWHGFTFNPGLRRLSDYQILAPIGELAGELNMSEIYHQKGFKAAIFPPGYVRHTGDHRGIRYKLSQNQLAKDFSVFCKRISAAFCRIFGI